MTKHPDIDWAEGEIDGCLIEPLSAFHDERGWLMEFFRSDDLEASHLPVMGYVSATRPGVARGPHEHEHQTDLFVFFHGRFRLFLWDARADSATYGRRRVIDLGADQPARVIVPPGVVHGYRNVGDDDALIINCPNKLYAGEGRSEPVDEIRHEDLPGSPFRMTA